MTNLLLWGEGGDEAAAVIFVTELRMAGFPVKVVGIGASRFKGAAGVMLVPDLTLTEALPLASRSLYVFKPFNGQAFQRFLTDPRVQQLIWEAHANGAIFVQSDQADHGCLDAIVDAELAPRLLIYPRGQALYEFIRRRSWSTQITVQKSQRCNET